MCYRMRTLTKLGVAMSDRFSGPAAEVAFSAAAGSDASDDIEEIAARLGITIERVWPRRRASPSPI